MRAQDRSHADFLPWRPSSKLKTGADMNPRYAQSMPRRAVHDYFAHIARAVTFSLRGEIAAYNAHVKMAPPDAVPALFTEVVGQACTYYATNQFQEQKIALLPFDYINVGVEVSKVRSR